MVDEEKNEREYKLNSESLISKNVVQIVDKFTSKNNLNKSKVMDGIIDPGVKSIDSVVSKMYRKAHIELDTDFSLKDIKDVIRCSIIVDNYNQVIPLIRELRKSIPSLKGDVCENSTGYIGIHLSLIINGFNAEIQISTKEGWYAKQAGEEIYERWRNFSLAKEVSEIATISDDMVKQEKIKQLFSHYNLKAIQLNYCRNMFSSLHKYTKLDKIKEDINAVLYLNNSNQIEEAIEESHKYNIKIKDMKNHDELMENCKNYLEIANEAKKDLLDCANKALFIIKNNGDEIKNTYLTQMEKDFVCLKKKYFSLIIEEMKRKFNGQLQIIKYISKVNKISNKLAFNNIDHLNYSSIDELNIDFNNEEIIKLEEIIRRDILSKNYFLSLISNCGNKDS